MPSKDDLARLRILSAQLGSPGVQALWTAARRRGLQLKRKDVEDWSKTQSTRKDLFAPLQPARGKTISEDNNRWQMDLIQVSDNAAKFYLVVLNVFDRFLYAKPLARKTAAEVKARLAEILDSAPKKPQFIGSDGGLEFTGSVSAMLAERKIVQTFTDRGDHNALGAIDRAIGLLKRKLAEMHAKTGEEWHKLLNAAVKALNATPKPGVLPEGPGTGDPAEQEEPGDQAEGPGSGRRPLPRGFQGTYGELQRAAKVEGTRVVSEGGGERYPLKRIKIVTKPL